MVDPEQKRVVVHHFGEEGVPMIYGFDGRIPVGIFEGKCEIDFLKIYENIAFLYEKEEDPDRK